MHGITMWIGSTGLALAMGANGLEPKAPASSAQPAQEDFDPSEPAAERPAPAGDPAQTSTQSAAIRAQQHFQAQRWGAASEALMEAYAADPDPAYLYARAQAERMRDNCRLAIPLYQRFLEHEATESQREETQGHIRLCEEMLSSRQDHPESPSSTSAPGSAPQPPDEPPAPTPPWYRDPTGLTLLATGTAVTAVGGIMWGLGRREQRRAPQAITEDAYDQQVAQGRRDIAVGVTLVSLGAGLVISSIIRLGVVGRRHRLSTTGWLGPSSGGAGIWTRF